MTEKPYSLETLKLICGGTASSIKDTLPWHVEREDGLYLDSSRRTNRGVDNPIDTAVIAWHPRRNHRLPALPIPFGARELAAFSLAGGGVFLLERYEENDVSDEDELEKLGQNADEDREAILEACRLRKAAIEIFGSTADGVNQAADWLLRDAPETPTAPSVGEPASMKQNRLQRREELLIWFREAGGKRPSESGKSKRGALARVTEKSGIDKDTLGEMLDKAIEDKKRADSFAQLTAKR